MLETLLPRIQRVKGGWSNVTTSPVWCGHRPAWSFRGRFKRVGLWFCVFPNGKQKWMLNSNKFSDTHGRLDSCYPRYVALKKCPWISSLSKKNTIMMMAYYVKWCLWCIIRCRFQHRYGLNVFCFPWFPVENDFPWFPMICLLFPMISGLFPVVKTIRIWPHGSGFFVDELQGQNLLSLAFLPDKISWDPGTNKWACLKIRDLQIKYIFFQLNVILYTTRIYEKICTQVITELFSSGAPLIWRHTHICSVSNFAEEKIHQFCTKFGSSGACEVDLVIWAWKISS